MNKMVGQWKIDRSIEEEKRDNKEAACRFQLLTPPFSTVVTQRSEKAHLVVESIVAFSVRRRRRRKVAVLLKRHALSSGGIDMKRTRTFRRLTSIGVFSMRFLEFLFVFKGSGGRLAWWLHWLVGGGGGACCCCCCELKKKKTKKWLATFWNSKCTKNRVNHCSVVRFGRFGSFVWR